MVLVSIGFRLRERRGFGDRLPTKEYQVAQHSVIESKRRLEVVYDLGGALDIHQHIVRLVNLRDGIGELSAPPVFQAMNAAFVGLDDGTVALDHRRHLLTLVRMDQNDDFVVSQRTLLSA